MDWTTILTAGAVGAVAAYIWNAVAWLALKHHKPDYRPVGEASRDKLEAALADVPPGNHWYVIPHDEEYEKGITDPELLARHRAGPNAIVIMLEPGPPMTGATFGRGFALNLAEGIGCGILFALSGVSGLGATLGFCLGVGLLISLSGYFVLANWAKLPWRFTMTSTFDKLVSFGLIGFAMHWLGPVAGTG